MPKWSTCKHKPPFPSFSPFLGAHYTTQVGKNLFIASQAGLSLLSAEIINTHHDVRPLRYFKKMPLTRPLGRQ